MSACRYGAGAPGGGDAGRWRRFGLAALLVANAVSVAGGGISLVALPWFVLTTTGSTAATGIAVACETLPMIAISLLSGTLIARWGALGIRIGSDVVSAITVLAIPVLHATVGIASWQLLVLVAVNGAVRAPAPSASLVLLDALSGPGEASADRGRGAYAASVRLAATASAPLGGALIAFHGAPAALVVDAATFAFSALALGAAVRVPARPGPPPRPAAAPRVRSGWRVLAHDRLLRVLCFLSILLAGLDAAWAGVLAPAYGQAVLHSPTALGGLLGCFGAGALAGNVAYAWLLVRANRHRLVWTCLGAATTLRFSTLGAGPALPVLIAAMLVAGFGAGVLGPLWLRLLTERVQRDLQGHVFGIAFAAEQGGGAAGALAAGLALTRVDLTPALLAAAAVGAAVALVAATAPPLRALGRPAPVGQRTV